MSTRTETGPPVAPANVIRVRPNDSHSSDAAVLQWLVVQEDDAWVAVCHALGLTAEGSTWGDLTETINDILDHLFRDLARRRKLDNFLRQRGWTYMGPQMTDGNFPDDVTFDVPWQTSRAPSREALYA